MTIALVANSAWIGGAPGNGATTAAINTTGANLLVACISFYREIDLSSPAVTDSKGNSYTALTPTNTTGSGAGSQIYYCASPTVGTSHTATVSGTNSQGAIMLYAFSGASSSPFDQQSHNTAASGTTIQPGSITPGQAGEVFVTACGTDSQSFPTPTISAPFNTPVTLLAVSNSWVGSGASYYIQGSASAENPTWTVASPFASNGAAMATFFASAGGSTTITAASAVWDWVGNAPVSQSVLSASDAPWNWVGNVPSIIRGTVTAASAAWKWLAAGAAGSTGPVVITGGNINPGANKFFNMFKKFMSPTYDHQDMP